LAILVMLRLAAVCVGLLSSAVFAETYQGSGRVSLLPSYRLSLQAPFYAAAAKAGYGAPGGLEGGPGLIGSFAYAATDNLEVSIDPFAATEQLTLTEAQPIRVLVYGVNLGLRILAWFTPDFAGFIGLHYGPNLIYAGGSTLVTTPESFSQTFGASAGAAWRLSEHWGVFGQYQFSYGGELKTSAGTILGRAHWFSLGVTYYFGRESTEYP
jgi:hypothetical protein